MSAEPDYAAALSGLRYVSDEDTPGRRHSSRLAIRSGQNRSLRQSHGRRAPPSFPADSRCDDRIRARSHKPARTGRAHQIGRPAR